MSPLNNPESGLKTDDVAFGVGSDSITSIGALADQTGPDSVDEGDIGILRMTLTRILLAALRGKVSAEADTPILATPIGLLRASSLNTTGITDANIGAGSVVGQNMSDDTLGLPAAASMIYDATNSLWRRTRSTPAGLLRTSSLSPTAITDANMGAGSVVGQYMTDDTHGIPAVANMIYDATGGVWNRQRGVATSGAGLGVTQVGTMGELITLAASAARTTGANGTAVTGLGWRNRYLILCDITASATDAGDTLDVYVDVSLDGSTWMNAVHFTQQAGNGAARKEFAVLDPSNPGAVVVNVTADAAAGVVRPAMFGPQMRARWAIADSGDANQSHTFSVVCYAI